MNRTLHIFAIIAGGLSALAVVVGILTPHPARPVVETEAALASEEPGYFFDLELRDASGALISHPRLVGMSGQLARLEQRASLPNGEPDPEGPPQMCIILDPIESADGLDMSIDLSLEGVVARHRSRLRMDVGARHELSIPTDDGGNLALTVLAYRLDSPEMDAYMRRLEARVAAARAPEA